MHDVNLCLVIDDIIQQFINNYDITALKIKV